MSDALTLPEIGIMQGRLSLPEGGRIQSFPKRSWRKEFSRAQKAGLASIEWIYEAETEALNPLGSDPGIEEVQALAKGSGVTVGSVCADYYMSERLVGDDGFPQGPVVEHLRWLLTRVGRLGARHVMLPFVDSSSLRSAREVEGLLAVLQEVIPVAEQAEVEIHLETDLPPDEFAALLAAADHPLVRANYDTGNSASLGYDPQRELPLLEPWLGSVHIKDRLRGGGTVPLDTGAADFGACFRLLAEIGFPGPFILQAARDEILDEVDLAAGNRRFVEDHFQAAARWPVAATSPRKASAWI